MFPFCQPLWLIECLYNFLRSIVIDMLVFRASLGPEVPEKRGGVINSWLYFLVAMGPMMFNVVMLVNDSRFWSHVVTGVAELFSDLPRTWMFPWFDWGSGRLPGGDLCIFCLRVVCVGNNFLFFFVYFFFFFFFSGLPLFFRVGGT